MTSLFLCTPGNRRRRFLRPRAVVHLSLRGMLVALAIGAAPAGSLGGQELSGYRIEFAALSGLTEAGAFSARVADALGNQGAVHVDMNPPQFEVWVGDFAERDDAVAALRLLRGTGIRGGRVVRSRVWRMPGSAAQASPLTISSSGAGSESPADAAKPPELSLASPSGRLAGAERVPSIAARPVVASRDEAPTPVDVLPAVPRPAGEPTPLLHASRPVGGPEVQPVPQRLPSAMNAAEGEPASRLSERNEVEPAGAEEPERSLSDERDEQESEAAEEASPPPQTGDPAGREAEESAAPGAESTDPEEGVGREVLVAEDPPAGVPVTEASVEYRGFHGMTTCSATTGWAFNPANPDERPVVQLFDGDRLVGTVIADVYRKDLEDAGFGDGRYGFRFAYEDDGAGPVGLEARVGGAARLRGTPQPNPCRAEEFAAREAGPVARPTVARKPEPEGADGPAKSVAAAGVAAGEIRLDGRLDEAVWTDAVFMSDLEQKGLRQGFPRPPYTRVAFLYDDEALYVGARMEGPEAQAIDTRVARRDEVGNVDRLLVSLDTRSDRRTAYTFGVTAGGTRLDHFHPEDREFPRDDQFDPVWEAKTTVDSTGWTAEMRIPFSQLRFQDRPGQRWGLNVRRWNPQSLMNHYWVVVPMEEQGWASRFGELRGLDGIDRSRRVEIAPYVLRGVTQPTGPGADAAEEGETTLRVGGDVKVGLGPDLTLDATVLPDFGQVEADPAEVNLTAFETAFEERRPFFTEGASLLRGRGPRYFYSRRVGSVPHGTDPGNAIDLPRTVDILGALKLTGRTDAGLSVGAMIAVTPEVSARTNQGAGLEGSTVVAPSTAYGAGRVERELGPTGSMVGLTLTGVVRALESGTVPASVLSREAISGGGDWSLRFDEGRYQVAGHLGFSVLAGDAAALSWIQRSSVHYFQRPDADHVQFDPERTSLAGYTGSVSVSKVVGTHWTWSVGASTESPGFNIRDAGLLRSADHRDLFGTVSYRRVTPSALFRHFTVGLETSASWNYGGVRQFLSPAVSLSGAFPNFMRPLPAGRLRSPRPFRRAHPGWPSHDRPLGRGHRSRASGSLSEPYAVVGERGVSDGRVRGLAVRSQPGCGSPGGIPCRGVALSGLCAVGRHAAVLWFPARWARCHVRGATRSSRA